MYIYIYIYIYTLRTSRDVSLFKKILVSRNKPRQIQNIGARDVDVLSSRRFCHHKCQIAEEVWIDNGVLGAKL